MNDFDSAVTKNCEVIAEKSAVSLLEVDTIDVVIFKVVFFIGNTVNGCVCIAVSVGTAVIAFSYAISVNNCC